MGAMSDRLQVAMLLAAMVGIYALVGMVDADEIARDAAKLHDCKATPKNIPVNCEHTHTAGATRKKIIIRRV